MSIIGEVKSHHASPAVIYHALYAFYYCGLVIAKIAKYFCKCPNTARYWIKKYETEGLVGRRRLAPAPSEFTLEERVWIYELFKNEPTKFLREAVAAFRKRFKKRIGKTTIWSILHRDWGMSWKVRVSFDSWCVL